MRSLGLSTPLVLSLSLVVWAAACDPKPAEGGAADRKTAEAPARPGGATPNAPEPTTEPAAKPARESAPKPKLDEAAKLRKQLTTLLNEGRALTKKGDYAGGIAKYRAALEIDSSDVSVLGELGWAAFRAGELDDAHRTTTQALKFVRAAKRRGMLLYNLGRVEQERGNLADAITHYQASLEARPGNATVEARLAAVEALQNQMAIAASAGGELEGPKPPTVATGLGALARDLPDLAAVCKVIEAERCEDYTLTGDEECRCETTLQATPGADASWGLVRLGDETMQAAWFPAVKTDKGWTVFSEVLSSYNPGAFGIFEDVEILPSTVEPLLEVGTQLVLTFDHARMDRDMGLNEIDTESFSATVVCARHETGAYCTRPLLRAYNYVREVEFVGEDEAITGEVIDHSDLRPATGFTSSFEFSDAKLVVTRSDIGGFVTEGELFPGGARWVLAAGEHALSRLLGLPD